MPVRDSIWIITAVSRPGQPGPAGQVQTCREDNKIQQSLDIGSLMVTSSRIDVGPIFYMGPGPGTVVNSLFISRSNCFQITTQLDRGPGLSELGGAAA